MLNMLVSFSVRVITKFDVEMQSFGTYIHERNVTKRILMARYLLHEYFFMVTIFDHFYTVLTVYCTLNVCSRRKQLCFPKVLMYAKTKLREKLRFDGGQN